MGKNKKAVSKNPESAATAATNHESAATAATIVQQSSKHRQPLSNITSDANKQTTKKRKNKKNKETVEISAKGTEIDTISCPNRPCKTYQEATKERELVSKGTLEVKVHRKKKKKGPGPVDDELQQLLDFIEGTDSASKTSTTAKKSKKKKKKMKVSSTKDIENVIQGGASNLEQVASEISGRKTSGSQVATKNKNKDCILKENAESLMPHKSRDVKDKKKSRKTGKKTSKEELELLELVKYIEGSNNNGKCSTFSEKLSDGNNNAQSKVEPEEKKKKKSKPKKGPTSEENFDFNALKDNTHLETRMIDYILKNPSSVDNHRIFKPKQVACFFMKGHNEHWELYPECDGRLKPLERSTQGFTLYDPGSKQLVEIVSELRQTRGKNITKSDLIEALKCHAYLKCEKCGYQSDVVTLQ